MFRQTLINKDRIELQRAQFAIELARALHSGRAVIYFDESRLDSWTTQSRSWSAAYTNNYSVKNTRMWSLTLYGAIGADRYSIFQAKGCNSENFAAFIPQLIADCGQANSKGKPVLIVD